MSRDSRGYNGKSISSNLLFLYFPIVVFLVISNKPAGDEFCFASNVFQFGFSDGFVENFKTNPFLFTSVIATLQGLAILENQFLAGIGVGLLFTVLVSCLINSLVERFDKKVSEVKYLYPLLFPIFVSGIGSYNLIFDNRLVVFYSGWIASFIHLIPFLAIMNLYLTFKKSNFAMTPSIYFLVLLATNFGFISSSFTIGLIVFYWVKDANNSMNLHNLRAKTSLVVLASTPLILAFVTGAAETRFSLATGEEFSLTEKLLNLFRDLPWILFDTIKIFLISLSIFNLILIIFIGLTLKNTNLLDTIRKALHLRSFGFAISYCLTIALWESVSYEAWWHYAVVSLIQSLTLISIFKDHILGFFANKFKNKITLLWVISLLLISPGVIDVIERQVAWSKGDSYSLASLADFGTDWVDSCVSKFRQ